MGPSWENDEKPYLKCIMTGLSTLMVGLDPKKFVFQVTVRNDKRLPIDHSMDTIIDARKMEIERCV